MAMDIVLISPRFRDCFWGLDLAAPLIGRRASLPQSCLPLLAALTPREHRVTLMDENAGDIDYDRCARADVVGVTGMSIQRFEMRRILEALKARGCFTAAGGPWVSARPDYFGPLADVVFVGEAEETWPRFLEDKRAGRAAARYAPSGPADLRTLPVPRFDLLRTRDYFFGTLQISRGCPHRCEFCDIIVLFGRRPRYKSGDQVVAELEAARRAGLRWIFVVDDNLIADRAAAAEVLGRIGDWQRKRRYPMGFMTQTTLELADEPELLRLMVRANFAAVFVGVESPNAESLRETGKLHNLKDGVPVEAKVRKIQQAGLVVWCGMIQGFDHDGPDVFERQREFLTRSRVPIVMSGMLAAIPGTALHARLAAEGRLDPGDPPPFGTNVVPKGMTPGELRDGYVRQHVALYNSESFFDRLDALFLDPAFEVGYARQGDYWSRHRLMRFVREGVYALKAVGLGCRLMLKTPDRSHRKEYRRRIARLLKVHRRPGLVLNYFLHAAVQHHAGTLAREMAEGKRPVVNTY